MLWYGMHGMIYWDRMEWIWYYMVWYSMGYILVAWCGVAWRGVVYGNDSSLQYTVYSPFLSYLVDKYNIVCLSNCYLSRIWRKCQSFYNVALLPSLDETINMAHKLSSISLQYSSSFALS